MRWPVETKFDIVKNKNMAYNINTTQCQSLKLKQTPKRKAQSQQEADKQKILTINPKRCKINI